MQKSKTKNKKTNLIDGCELENIFISPMMYELICEESPKFDSESEELSGFIDVDYLTIHVKSSLPYQKKAVIILHEILHGMLMHTGLNLKEKDDEMYEHIVESLSHSLFALIRSNPKLIEYLQQKVYL